MRAPVLKGPEVAKRFFSSATSSRDMKYPLRYTYWVTEAPQPGTNQTTRLCEPRRGPVFDSVGETRQCYDSESRVAAYPKRKCFAPKSSVRVKESSRELAGSCIATRDASKLRVGVHIQRCLCHVSLERGKLACPEPRM